MMGPRLTSHARSHGASTERQEPYGRRFVDMTECTATEFVSVSVSIEANSASRLVLKTIGVT
jgi:hypothetical protein